MDLNRSEGTKENLAALYRQAFDVEEETGQVHLVDLNREPTEELGAIGGVVPEIIHSSTEAMETSSKKHKHTGGKQCKERRKLKRQLSSRIASGHVVPHGLAPAQNQSGLLGASPKTNAQQGLLRASSSASSAASPFMITAPSLQQGFAAYVLPGPCIIMPLPGQGPSGGRGTSGTSSQTRSSSYKKL